MTKLIDASERWLPDIAALERQCFSDPWSVEMLRPELPDDSHEFCWLLRAIRWLVMSG